MTKKEINSQIDYITIAKAIGIIMVVCGHIGGIYKIIGIPVFNSKPSEIFPIYSYHMPLFIFISGYLDKILTIVSEVKAVFLAFPLKLA